MTTNKINSQCPNCSCTTADVLSKNFEAHATKQQPDISITYIVVKCTAKNHQYRLDPKGTNTEWKKFFK